jgi:hypothetical protein
LLKIKIPAAVDPVVVVVVVEAVAVVVDIIVTVIVIKPRLLANYA